MTKNNGNVEGDGAYIKFRYDDWAAEEVQQQLKEQYPSLYHSFASDIEEKQETLIGAMGANNLREAYTDIILARMTTQEPEFTNAAKLCLKTIYNLGEVAAAEWLERAKNSVGLLSTVSTGKERG